MPLWDKTYSVSVPEMDHHHKHLLDLLNQLYQAMRDRSGMDVVGHILDDALEYTGTHFTAEEAMLEAYQYPDLYKQKVQHNKFVREILALQAKYERDDPIVCMATVSHLSEWFINHIRNLDKQYSSYFAEKKITPQVFNLQGH